MNELYAAVVCLVLVFVALLFLVIRLRLFAGERVTGRSWFVLGGVLTLLAAGLEVVSHLSGYTNWFVMAAYAWIDVAQLLLLVGGVLMLVVGLSLYSDFWQTKGEEISARDRKLSLLENLQQVAREPYHLMELLDLGIKEILAELPECAGAVFLLNRPRRQLVLSASLGMTKTETASLEYYPFERNVVSQVVDQGEPIISGTFDLYSRSGSAEESRFRSSLVLPLVSGMEKIGAIVLLAEQPRFFSRAEVRYLSPVSEWLAEKIKSARLGRELATARKELEWTQQSQADLSARLLSTAGAFSAEDAVALYCRSLVGLFSSGSVHLLGMVGGALDFHGGSEPLLDMTENYRIALIDALGRNKPLVINQEAVTEGRSYIAQSTLFFPIQNRGRQDALLFRRESGPFKVSEEDLKTVDIFARLGAVIISQSDTKRLDITRRKGFGRILQLLQFKAEGPVETGPSFLMDTLVDLLPPKSLVVMFDKLSDGSFKAGLSSGGDRDTLAAFHILPGEGMVGRAAQTQEPHFAFGRTAVNREMDALQITNREALHQLLGEQGLPDFVVACPLVGMDSVTGVAVACAHGVTESQRGEWERLLTLATGLYSLRLTIAELRRTQTPAMPKGVAGDGISGVVGRLNNHFSAMIGNAELAASRSDLPGEVKSHIESIITEVELASKYVTSSLGRISTDTGAGALSTGSADINAIVREFLNRARISEGLYMVGERPREIDSRFHPVVPVQCTQETVSTLVSEAVNRFSLLAIEDELLTISTYRLGENVFLDVSRHRRVLPPVERVAGFGVYRTAREAVRLRPDDSFLTFVVDKPCFYCYDQSSPRPSFFSLRFPVAEQSPAVDEPRDSRVRILAIDDQTVILDLITAMCHSLGYRVTTAASGEEGVRLAAETRFDIVLADLAMPGMSGLEVANRVKKLDPDVPVVLVTGWEVAIEPAQLEAAGVSGLLHKPFRIEQLTDIINSAATRQSTS